MKSPTPLFIGLSWLAAFPALAANQPRGTLIELHSCEVYAGACMVSSQSTLSGRYVVQAWNLNGGSWQGIDLAGLQVAVLETSTDHNLAVAQSHADQAVIYLPENASPEQRHALLGWLQQRDPQLANATPHTRIVPISIVTSPTGTQVMAGQFLSFRTAPLGNCENRVCGESLWYEPTTPTSVFTVAENAGAQVNEPLLELKWADHGKRSAFVAQFGTTATAQNLYVQSDAWCGAVGNSL